MKKILDGIFSASGMSAFLGHADRFFSSAEEVLSLYFQPDPFNPCWNASG